ncbi:MAG: hypothetical protein WA191_05265, partial [Telluria sp.]
LGSLDEAWAHAPTPPKRLRKLPRNAVGIPFLQGGEDVKHFFHHRGHGGHDKHGGMKPHDASAGAELPRRYQANTPAFIPHLGRRPAART